MNNNAFSGWSIDKAVYDWMTKHLPEGKTILEFGSGNSTQILATRWNVISVEENKDWVNKSFSLISQYKIAKRTCNCSFILNCNQIIGQRIDLK